MATELAPAARGGAFTTKDRLEILISGFGGQGVVRMGQILGLAAIHAGSKVTMLKSHGTETRGGYVRAQVVISPGYVDSPVVEHADFMVAFSQSAYNKFYDLAVGKLLYDPELVQSIRQDAPERHVCVPATQLSKDNFNNSALFANSIMLGALTKLAEFDVAAVNQAMLETLPRFHEANVKAFAMGCNLLL
ncbi:MAG: 2-oxoacid:acceptor oxidoreductase family protein [Chloroflexota bacterium]|nr:2-oxoacid:acceptor oxidoreductase family protein [Chloroflexota bacterium]